MRKTLMLIFGVIICLSAATAFGQAGYRIDFKIKGWTDSTAYLAFYMGESTYIKDTAVVSSKGEFFFDNKKPLPEGLYFLVRNKRSIFDFVVGKSQHFKIETSSDDYIRNLSSSDEDNKLFFENQKFLTERGKEIEPIVKILKDTVLKDEAKKKAARAEYSKVSEKVQAFQGDIITKHPSTVTARILNSTRPVDVPPAPKRADGTIDSTFQLKYYRAHFFDNFDIADDAMIRLPKNVYQEKVKEYLEKLFLPQADSVTKAIDGLVAKAKKNQETYKIMVYSCAVLYSSPSVMGLDQVFVNLYNKYFATGEMDYWANKQLKQNFKDLAEKIGRAQIGTIAPNLMMQDIDLKPKSLYDLKKKYTVVYFFDPDCGHCRQESPKLVDFYNKNKVRFDLEVFAVSSDTSIKKLRDYVHEMKMTWVTVDGPRSYLPKHYTLLYYSESFPTVYILDSKKKVIARKLPVDKIETFLSNYEKLQAMKKGS